MNIFILILLNWFPCNEKIYYSEDLIWSWEYYTGEIDSGSTYSAISCFGREFDAELIDSLVYNVSCKTYFDPNCSWSKATKDSILLNHELYHFKLEEYVTQCFLYTLEYIESESGIINLNDYSYNVNLADSISDILSLQYDELTDYGRIYKVQFSLQQQIDSALNSVGTLEAPYLPH